MKIKTIRALEEYLCQVLPEYWEWAMKLDVGKDCGWSLEIRLTPE